MPIMNTIILVPNQNNIKQAHGRPI